jgi:DNA-binding transcriptional regulator GbsR (MarR family)
MRSSKIRQAQLELLESFNGKKDICAALGEELDQAAAKYEELTSSRQFYQELELKDASLTAAKKQCEEYRELESKLASSIAALTRAVPRFLMKLTKHNHPIPSEDQVPPLNTIAYY